MKHISKYLPLAAAAIVIILISLYFINTDKPAPVKPMTLDQRQEQFVEYVDTVQLQNKTPVYEKSSPLCVERGEKDCTLSKTFIYTLDGNYRDNGQEIFAYLKTKGFDFRKDSKYKDEIEQKLRNTTFADNLSDTEPIIVDLYNPRKNARVRVNLGDYGRTMSRVLGPLSEQQLIAGLQFYSP